MMDQAVLFYVAIVVFSLMIMGLALTFWEFTRGAPHRQAQASRNEQDRFRSPESWQRM